MNIPACKKCGSIMHITRAQETCKVGPENGDPWYRTFEYEFYCFQCDQVAWGVDTVDCRKPICIPEEDNNGQVPRL